MPILEASVVTSKMREKSGNARTGSVDMAFLRMYTLNAWRSNDVGREYRTRGEDVDNVVHVMDFKSSKGHYNKLEMAIHGSKSCFMGIRTRQADLMITGSEVDLGNDLSTMKLIKKFINRRAMARFDETIFQHIRNKILHDLLLVMRVTLQFNINGRCVGFSVVYGDPGDVEEVGVESGSPIRVMVEPLNWKDIFGTKKFAKMGPNDPSHDIPITTFTPSTGRTKKRKGERCVLKVKGDGLTKPVTTDCLGDAKPRKAAGDRDRDRGVKGVIIIHNKQELWWVAFVSRMGVRAIEGGKGELLGGYVEAVGWCCLGVYDGFGFSGINGHECGDLFVVSVIGEEILLIEAEIEELDDVTMNEEVEGNVNLEPKKMGDVIEDIYEIKKLKQNLVNNPQKARNKGGRRGERIKSGREIAMKAKAKRAQKSTIKTAAEQERRTATSATEKEERNSDSTHIADKEQSNTAS
nr:hypothetical protein [Tanacetum cinerariifolium]